jgi:hypothetical protein
MQHCILPVWPQKNTVISNQSIFTKSKRIRLPLRLSFVVNIPDALEKKLKIQRPTEKDMNRIDKTRPTRKKGYA